MYCHCNVNCIRMNEDTANMNEKLKIGILGGTFNPIHSGHLYLAESAMKKVGLAKVLFVPSNISYMKNQADIASVTDRIAMVNLAIKDKPDFVLSKVDVERGGNSYSFKTISDIREHYPGAELYFIIGADTLYNMEEWQRPDVIFAQTVILVAYRSGEPLEHLQAKIHELENVYHARIVLVAVERIDISSSEIRTALKMHRPITDMVPEAVEDYINRHMLYL